jgi:hypothetical protein
MQSLQTRGLTSAISTLTSARYRATSSKTQLWSAVSEGDASAEQKGDWVHMFVRARSCPSTFKTGADP